MSVDIEPRVFYRSPNGAFCIGPLGVYDVGDMVDVEGNACVVKAIEPDGAGVACVGGADPVRFPCQSLAMQTARQREQMTAQILSNRAAHGLSAVDPRTAA